MKTVFLGSTAKDLVSFRDVVYHAIGEVDGFRCVRIEDLTDEEVVSDEICQQKIKECSLFVCLIGLCYGETLPDSDRSPLEREYHAAISADMERLIFVSADDTFYPGYFRESDAQWQKQQAFRALMTQEARRDTFSLPDELKTKVVEALHEWEHESQIITQPDFFEQRAPEVPHAQPFDHAICQQASLMDLDLTKVTEFFQRPLVQRQQDYHPQRTVQDHLTDFGLFQGTHPTYAALLCFGQTVQRWLAGASVRCVYWRNKTRTGGWRDDQEVRGNLITQYETSLHGCRPKKRHLTK